MAGWRGWLGSDEGEVGEVYLLIQCESGRQSCLKIDLFFRDGVAKFQKLGVKEIASIAREAG